jgi:hypothetical protein
LSKNKTLANSILFNRKVIKLDTMKTIFTILIASMTLIISGQTSTFKWSDMICRYISSFDSTKYSRDQIKNCYLFTKRESYTLFYVPVFYQPKLIQKYKLDSLDNEYKRKEDKLRTCDLPKTEYWEASRKAVLTELDQVYELNRIAFLSLSYPRILKQFNHNDYCLDKHSKCLIAGGDSLLNDLYSLILDFERNNGNPANAQGKYDAIIFSNDKFFNARLYVTSYGWWNCANKYINYSNDINKAGMEFRKLFIETKEVNCDGI